MKILVTGATGFVGQHVVRQLLESGHTVVAMARSGVRARTKPWFDQVEFIAHDLHNAASVWQQAGIPDALIHLAWPGLPDYKNFFHIARNLPADLFFLESAVKAGVPRLIVAGTCLEYGMQYGPLSEESATQPCTPYGFAKDALRKSLELLQKNNSFKFQWVRLFYMYGEGQNANSLLSQLDKALHEGRERFEMSTGNQLRDYLPIETVARCFGWVTAHPEMAGVINCCSGHPISVLDLVNQHISKKSGAIQLARGIYPCPDYEPMAFWGIPEKLQKAGFFA